MKILYIAQKIPYPIYQDGGTLMNYNILKRFNKNHSIDLLTFSDQEFPLNYTSILCENYYEIKDKSVLTWKHYLKSILFFLPPFYFNKSTQFENKIKDLIKMNEYDAIYIDSIHMEKYSKGIKHPKKIISLHDSISLLYNTFYNNTNKFGLKVYYKICSIIFKRYENKTINSYTKCFFVSDKDINYLKNNNKNVKVIPNGVDLETFNYNNEEKLDENIIVFSGIMDYKPNVDAVIYFCEKVLPLVIFNNPTIKFHIIGKNPTIEIKQLASENIVITGWVENIAEHIKKGIIYVSPLITGAGLKNKILEAMALKIPIIATTISIDGINVINEKHICIVDSPVLFAAKINELLRDESKRNNLINNSFNLINENYNWDKIVEQYIFEIQQ